MARQGTCWQSLDGGLLQGGLQLLQAARILGMASSACQSILCFNRCVCPWWSLLSSTYMHYTPSSYRRGLSSALSAVQFCAWWCRSARCSDSLGPMVICLQKVRDSSCLAVYVCPAAVLVGGGVRAHWVAMQRLMTEVWPAYCVRLQPCCADAVQPVCLLTFLCSVSVLLLLGGNERCFGLFVCTVAQSSSALQRPCQPMTRMKQRRRLA